MSNNTSDQQPQKTSALEYPCDFVIKAMGKNNDAFKDTTKKIILDHFPDRKDDITFKEVPSKDGNYTALSAKLVAQNQQEMDKCYQALSDEPLVLIAL